MSSALIASWRVSAKSGKRLALVATDRDAPQLLSPEQRLCAAILEEALSTLWRTRDLDAPGTPDSARRRYRQASHRRARTEAIAWFRSTAADHAFTFEAICAALGIEATDARRALEANGWVPRSNPRPCTRWEGDDDDRNCAVA